VFNAVYAGSEQAANRVTWNHFFWYVPPPVLPGGFLCFRLILALAFAAAAACFDGCRPVASAILELC
jgi:hypothetical protein